MSLYLLRVCVFIFFVFFVGVFFVLLFGSTAANIKLRYEIKKTYSETLAFGYIYDDACDEFDATMQHT